MKTTREIPSFDQALCLARQSLYRLSALALTDPRGGSWEELRHPDTRRLVAQAAAIVREEPGARVAELARGELGLEDLDPREIFARLPASPGALNDLHERAFGLVVSGPCSLHETEYMNGKYTFQRGQHLADASGFYLAFGLRPSRARRERHDHIALELEFQTFLAGLETQAAASDDPRRAERLHVVRDAERRFLEEHLAWWVPTFARLLSLECRGGYYEAVARFLAALIAAERALLGVRVPETEAAPSRPERPEACEGCGLGGAVV